MSTRISTAGFHAAALGAMMDAQSALAKTQAQVASGRRINSPADDPVGATRIQDLSRQLEASGQYARNSDVARSRLSFEEQAFADITTALNRIRELTLQAANATVDPTSRAMIRAEVEGRVQDLLDIANRRDSQGEYLFAGLATLTRPFERTAAGVVYRGDQGERFQQVSETQKVADGHSGFEAFMRIPEGNGTFVTSGAGSNAGSGGISVGHVIDRSAWDGGNYVIRFSAPDAWEVLDDAAPVPNVVASGAYASGQAIEFAGISVEVTGVPQAGDEFSVRGAGKTDLFTAMDALLALLGSPTESPADKARFNAGIAGALAQLDRELDHSQEMRAAVGVRLNTLDAADSTRETHEIDLESLLSDIRDLDYAEAVSRLNRQYVGLQAAQQSFAKIGQLSLFDYL